MRFACVAVLVSRERDYLHIHYVISAPITGQLFGGSYSLRALPLLQPIPRSRKWREWERIWNALPGHMNRYELYDHDKEG